MITSAGGAVTAGAVVRVRDGDAVVGGGFLVGPDLVATCTHVAAAALGGDPYASSAPDAPVQIDFPLTTSGAAPSRPVEAVVWRWVPIAEDGSGDVTLLRLTAPPPRPAYRRCAASTGCGITTSRCWAFPRHDPTESGPAG